MNTNPANHSSKTLQGLTAQFGTELTPQMETGETAKRETHPLLSYSPTRNRAYKPRARRCKSCGHDFTPKAKHARYCSDRCRKAAWRKSTRKKTKPVEKVIVYEVVVCACCGKSFFANEGTGTKHCSSSCRTKAWRMRRDAALEALIFDMGIGQSKAADLIEIGGMRKITAYLIARGYTYDATAKAWIMPTLAY